MDHLGLEGGGTMTTDTPSRRPDPRAVVGAPPAGTPAYGGPPMTMELWLAKYFPTLAAWRKRLAWEMMEKMDGPFDATEEEFQLGAHLGP